MTDGDNAAVLRRLSQELRAVGQAAPTEPAPTPAAAETEPVAPPAPAAPVESVAKTTPVRKGSAAAAT